MKPDSIAKMKKLEKNARLRILARGKIDFRVEPELMAELLDLARQRKMPLGKVVRELVKAQLGLRIEKTPNQLDKIERKIDKLLSLRSA